MSHIILRPLRFLITCTSEINSTPFEWDKAKGQVRIFKNRKRLIAWYINVFLMTLFTSFHIIRFFSDLSNTNIQAYERILHFFWVNMSFNGLVNEYTLVRNRDETLLVINRYVQFQKDLTEKYCKKKLKTPLLSFGEIVICAGYQHSCLATMLYIEDPTNRRYLYSVVCPNDTDATWIGIGIFALIEIYFLIHNWNIIFFYVCYMFVYISGLKFWMDEICVDKDDTLTSQKLRSRDEMIKVFRAMQVTNNSFNLLWAPIILPVHKLAVIISTISVAYGAVRVYGKVKFISYASQPVKAAINTSYQLMAYPLAGRMMDDSDDIFHSWNKYRGTNKLTRKFIRSCPPLAIEVGHYYVFTKETTFEALGIVVNYFFTVLMEY